MTFQALALRQGKFRSDEGLMLETSAFQMFHGGNSPFMNSFDKNKFTVTNNTPLKTGAAHVSFKCKLYNFQLRDKKI